MSYFNADIVQESLRETKQRKLSSLAKKTIILDENHVEIEKSLVVKTILHVSSTGWINFHFP